MRNKCTLRVSHLRRPLQSHNNTQCVCIVFEYCYYIGLCFASHNTTHSHSPAHLQLLAHRRVDRRRRNQRRNRVFSALDNRHRRATPLVPDRSNRVGQWERHCRRCLGVVWVVAVCCCVLNRRIHLFWQFVKARANKVV